MDNEKINEVLEHAGIKGMKWGVRRFQNKDGSLTPEGKKRYADDRVDNDDEASKDYKLTYGKKSLKSMTNEELQRVITRQSLEKRYQELNPEKKSFAKKVTEAILKKTGDAAVEVTGQAAKSIIKGGTEYGLIQAAKKNPKIASNLRHLGILTIDSGKWKINLFNK